MDQILDAPQQENITLPYAGFWIRVGAYLIDGLLLGIVNVIISFLYQGNFNIYQSSIELTIISYLLAILYFAFMESSDRQGTLGKMALGLKVGDERGNKITFLHALGRYIVKYILSIVTLTVSLMWVGWDDKKQSLHDKIVSTYVYEK